MRLNAICNGNLEGEILEGVGKACMRGNNFTSARQVDEVGVKSRKHKHFKRNVPPAKQHPPPRSKKKRCDDDLVLNHKRATNDGRTTKNDKR